MKKISTAFILSIIAIQFVVAQSKEEIVKIVDETNQMIDRAVVSKDIAALQKHYGDDFVFTHGTGDIDSKESWIQNIKGLEEGNRYISREHDSTLVEPHGDIAIIKGKLSVERQGKDKINKYGLKYVRVYALRKKVWQLISHRTFMEWHMN